MEKYTVRIARPEDLPVLLEFEQGVIRSERPYDSTLAQDPITYYDISELMALEDAEVVVAEHSGKIIASGYARKKKARHYLDHEYYSYLGFMYTLPEHRGKGVNKLILKALRKWSVNKGLTEIRLTVYDGNQSAIRAYEKVGFKKHIIEMRLE